MSVMGALLDLLEIRRAVFPDDLTTTVRGCFVDPGPKVRTVEAERTRPRLLPDRAWCGFLSPGEPGRSGRNRQGPPARGRHRESRAFFVHGDGRGSWQILDTGSSGRPALRVAGGQGLSTKRRFEPPGRPRARIRRN